MLTVRLLATSCDFATYAVMQAAPKRFHETARDNYSSYDIAIENFVTFSAHTSFLSPNNARTASHPSKLMLIHTDTETDRRAHAQTHTLKRLKHSNTHS